MSSAVPTISVFATDTAVASDSTRPGVFTANLTDRWDIGDKPNGGYVIATAVRAMAAVVPEHPHPFSVTAHYLRPGETGPCEIQTELVRTGRKLATVRATLQQGGKAKIAVLGTFGDLDAASGPTVIAGAPPELPVPERCQRRLPEHFPTISALASRTETLLHPDSGWNTGTPNGNADVRAWTRFSDGSEPDPLSLLFFADSLPPAVFEVLDERVWIPTIELTVHVRAKPAPGWLRAHMRTRFLMNGYLEEDGELWDSTGTLVAQSRQLGMVFTP